MFKSTWVKTWFLPLFNQFEKRNGFFHVWVERFDQSQRTHHQTVSSKTRRDVSLLSEFLKSKQENWKIEETQPQELNDFLSEFIVAVKEKMGTIMNRQASEGL